MSPAGAFAILHDFTPEEGTPYAGLTPVSGGFAGVTASGAFGNHGGVFFMTETGATAMVYAFTGDDGDTPWAPPTRAVNGALFGTTVRGGARDLGTVYRIWPGGAFSTLHAFSGADGALPYARLVAGADGYLYGTTTAGGCHGRGTVFRISPLFGAFSTVHCFGPGEGRVPLAPLLQGRDGNLYGTTVYGGDADWGTIYRLSPSGAFTTLHTFRWPRSWSVTGFTAYPRGPLIESPSGVFHGTTYGYGFGGSAFQMTSDGHVSLIAFSYPTLQCCFQVIRGTSVTGDITDTASGDLYVTGQTHYGNAVLLKASRFWPGSQSPMPFETVLSLGPPGAPVPDPPMEGRDGLFYGVAPTADGGTGAIYRVDLAGDGSLVTLKVLADIEGSAPVGRPVEGPDGHLYGTTTGGGPGGRGVVFAFRPD